MAYIHKIKGFTLAEILITLAIIGIIAALTIRSVVVDSEKLITETKLKKVYAELQHALNIGAVHNGKMRADDFGVGTNVDVFDIYFAPYLRVDKICYDEKGKDCGYKSGHFWKRRDQNYEQSFQRVSAHGTNMHRTMAKLQNGAVVLLVPFSCSPNCANAGDIYIDIDGPKGKNLYGRDVFIFTMNFDKNVIIPKNNNDSLNSVKNKCKTTGHWCAAWIVKSGWKIPKDYPW